MIWRQIALPGNLTVFLAIRFVVHVVPVMSALVILTGDNGVGKKM
jgi:hypothetical protein